MKTTRGFKSLPGLSGAVAVLMLVSACDPPATGVTPSGKTLIGESFVLGSVEWERLSGTRTNFVFAVRERGGMTELCGAAFTEGVGTIRQIEGEVLRTSYFVLDGRTLVNDLAFFNRIPTLEAGETANCVVTGVPWKPGYDAGQVQYRSNTTAYTI